jgi:hypothetical protein
MGKIMKMKELLKMIDELLSGQYDPWDFSYDFPNAMVEHGVELEKENAQLLDELQQNFPEICAALDDEKEYQDFKNQIREEYKRVKQVCNIK